MLTLALLNMTLLVLLFFIDVCITYANYLTYPSMVETVTFWTCSSRWLSKGISAM